MPKMSKTVVGITGSISSGKSTLLNKVKSLGYFTINLDELVHKLYQKPNSLFYIVDEAFNLNSSNEIDRKKLASIVFKNKEELDRLNKLVHPVIKSELKKLIDLTEESYIFVEIPLLFEAKFEEVVDIILLAYCSEDIQITRLMNRNNLKYDEATKLINKQMKLADKLSLSDYVVDTTTNERFDQDLAEFLRKLVNRT